MWSFDVQHLAELLELDCVLLPSVSFWLKFCFIIYLFMDQSHKGGCRALHVYCHTLLRLYKSYLMKMLWSKESSCCPECSEYSILRNWYVFLSWILNSRKYGKAEEEHLTLSNFASLFLPFSVLPLKLQALSHGCLHMAVALLRPTETSVSVKVCKTIMCLFLQSDLLRNWGGLASPSYW